MTVVMAHQITERSNSATAVFLDGQTTAADPTMSAAAATSTQWS
ncbi:MAG: hypothetical protein ACRDY6_21695 [Acidimicrobiia bacterium]